MFDLTGFFERWADQAESEQTAAAPRERASGFLRVCSRLPGRVDHPADLP